ncbi:flagellar hook-length control protein FliK [Phenylobacterium sp.]|uniref:flagellar hook-length control protein FliK n=1 Tax=Phenylobacterium sp. TaxID=1871053 RepID=UPI0035618ECF
MSVAPISPAAALLRAQILGAAETELMALIGAVQEPATAAPEALKKTAPPTAAPPAPPPDPVRQAVATAKAQAAGQQTSLAPLFANLAQALTRPGLPAPVQAAIGQVLQLQTPVEGPFTAETIRQAVAQSGLFLEAHLAQAAPDAPPPPDLKAALLTLQRALSPAPAPDSAPPAQPAASPVRGPVPAGQAPALPSLPADADATTMVRDLLTHLPQPTPDEAPTPPPPTPELKAALLTLQRALSPPAPPDGAPPAPQAASPERGPVLAGQAPALPGLPVDTAVATMVRGLLEAYLARAAPGEEPPPEIKAALLTLQRALSPLPPPEGLPPAPRTPPPVRGAAMAGQAPTLPDLPAGADLATVAKRLGVEVEQALARQTLHQLASVPDRATPPTWMFELPIATPQGTGVAQFQVEHDAPEAGADGTAESWRARFSVDLEPLGPVHVHLAMSGDRAAVTVWAERPESVEVLRSQGEELARALPGDVVFRLGAPRPSAPASGQFVDQTS